MNFKQVLKHQKNTIQEYLEHPHDPIKSYKLFKPRKQRFFNTPNEHTYSKVIRKVLQITNDQLYQNDKMKDYYTTGLYHNRNEDLYDMDHIDCVEDGFCMNHQRPNENGCRYKHHYHCKHGMCTRVYQKTNHGERKWFSNNFVCFHCCNCVTRKFKNGYISIEEWPKCSKCQTPMTSVSVAFQPPSKRDIKHWKKLDDEWYDDSRLTYDEYVKLKTA